mgnify:CR=1 FL=1
MRTSFKLRSGNNPNKKSFFQRLKKRLKSKAKKLANIRSVDDFNKASGLSDAVNKNK